MKTKPVIMLTLLGILVLALTAGYAFFTLNKSTGNNMSSPIPVDTANAFFDECAADIPTEINPDTHKEMCACAAVNLQSTVTLEEYTKIRKIRKKRKKGSDAYSKFLTFVHGPCLKLPVRDYIQTTCLENIQYQKRLPDIKKMCNCTSTALASYTSLYAPDILSERLKDNLYFENAIEPLVSSKEFTQKRQFITLECLKDQDYAQHERPSRKRSPDIQTHPHIKR